MKTGLSTGRAQAGLKVAAGLAAASLAAWLLWYPLRHAAPFLDDYVFLALGVHIDSPWSLLFGDAMGSFFFRPVVMFLWALSVKVLGADAPAQYALNLGLHAANGLLLFALARRFGIRAGVAALAALLFVVHPTTFSTAAWLSDRFDLVALLFGLGALIELDAFLGTRRMPLLARATLLLLLALLSKEIAYALAPVALGMVWLRWREGVARRDALVAAAAVLGGVAVALALRALVLRSVASTMFLDGGAMASLADGFARFFRYLPAFVGVRHGSPAAVLAQALLLVIPLALLAAALRKPRPGIPARALHCAGAGVLIVAGCAVAQAPVMHASPIQPFDFPAFQFISLAGSRFYYVACAGIALVAAGVGEAFVATLGLVRPAAAAAALATLVAAAGMTAESRTIGREWDAFIADDARLLQAAVQVVRSQPDATPGCKIFLLDLPDPDQSLTSMLDTAVKQALPPGDPRSACFIQSEHTPWYHLLDARNLPSGAESPLAIITFGGKPYPPLRVGNLEYFYLKSDDAAAIVRAPAATFYAWNDGRFADVTALVRSGHLRVRFFDNRPPL